MRQPAADLVRGLQKSWPGWLPPALGPSGPPAAGHPLASEVAALLDGQAASLPFFPGTPSVAWVTVAPDADHLASSLADLRAWILPSLGWEDGRGTVVTGAGGALGASLLALSPGGYIRWRSRADAWVVTEIVRRLAQARDLAGAIPRHALTPVPALIELRQQLSAALAASDRIAAEDVLATLNRLRLDTAQNALLTRIRVLDHFGDARQLVEMPELDQLLRVRLPQIARAAIARAFHRRYLAPHESSADLADAKATYALEVDPRIGPLLDGLRPESGAEVRRLLAYRAAAAGSGGRESIDGVTTDPVVAILLPPVPKPPTPAPPSDEVQFFAAWQTQDWEEVQRFGLALLPARQDIAPVLRRSLEYRPNPVLRDALAPAASTGTPPPTRAPQSWGEWLAAIATADIAELERFLVALLTAERLPLSLTDGREIAERLTDLETAPTGHLEVARRNVLLTGLAEIAGDCIRAVTFPSAGFLDLYRAIALCWGEWKRGSAYPPDGQILLEMADGILQHAPADEGWLAEQVMHWWDARPSRSLLPFMLGAVELFHRLVGAGPAERLWIGVGTFVRVRGTPLTPGERILWRRVGADIGYDAATLDEYVPLTEPGAPASVDPLAVAGLKKIAVVSTREEQAARAAEQLRERTGADVLVVSATAGGHETDAAATTDVIAFVWSATTHAVFRALDKVDRRKIAYVRGTGAASIVLAIERWLLENAS